MCNEVVNDARGDEMKKVTQPKLIGDRGETIAGLKFEELGFSWSPYNKSLDVGIDGIVEIIDSQSGNASGQYLAIQVKSTASAVQDSPTNLEVVCSARDVGYWLDHSLPVLLVMVDVRSHDAYWISVKDRLKGLPRTKSVRLKFDKRSDKLDPKAREVIAHLGMPSMSGFNLPPIPKKERLRSNLLRVTLPGSLWCGVQGKGNATKLKDALRGEHENYDLDWAACGKHVLSFHDLTEERWKGLCEEGTAERYDTGEWSRSSDLQRRNDFTNLLRRCLLMLARRLDLVFDKDTAAHFFAPSKDLTPYSRGYTASQQRSGREVFGPYPRGAEGADIKFYRHSAFIGDFEHFGGEWYLSITPTYRFTSDGRQALVDDHRLQSGIRRLERNPALLTQVQMWRDVLRPKSMFSNKYPFLVLGELEEFDLDDGLDDEAWVAVEDDEEAKILNAGDEQMDLFEE